MTPVLRRYRTCVETLAISRKPDGTLLTEADLAVEETIAGVLRSVDPEARLVSEEALPSCGTGERVWIIDPIDGTSEFARPEGVEYCSVVCLVEYGVPVGALILAPELRMCIRTPGRREPVELNGIGIGRPSLITKRASVTRSASTKPRAFEKRLAKADWSLKTRTTSQTLDMVRTCLDIAEPFGLFYREQQKLWDGVAGICLARQMGLHTTDRRGGECRRIEIPLIGEQPTFESTVVASREVARWFVEDILCSRDLEP